MTVQSFEEQPIMTVQSFEEQPIMTFQSFEDTVDPYRSI